MSAMTSPGRVADWRTRRLVRGFDRFMPQSLLVARYGEETAAVMRQEMREEYRRLIPGVPHIGRDGTPDRRFLHLAASALAVYRVVLRHGGDLEDAGRLLYEGRRAFWQRLPAMLRPVLRWYIFSGLRRRNLERAARNSQARKYPADSVFAMVSGDGQPFDYGRDYTECGAVKYLHTQGADELTPYLCEWDYIGMEALGIQFQRTQTLAFGCERCDFRMTKSGTTYAPWPPEFVERTCGQAHAAALEPVQAP